jgi:hemerythrin-like domain-containing protein
MKKYNYVSRRNFVAGTALLLSNSISLNNSFAGEQASTKENEKSTEKEVSAVEDLMREHGVLRRILVVYSETARRLIAEPEASVYEPLGKAAQLFRDFGEDYHEKALEEAYIFPAVSKTTGEASSYPEILIAQHRRGREITDYIITAAGSKEPYDRLRLSLAMDTFVRMYRPHAAREDTIVFPAWKQALTEEQLDEMSEKFEDIEHQRFGEDGFEKAVKQIADIEKQLGLADLAKFTAPPVEV